VLEFIQKELEKLNLGMIDADDRLDIDVSRVIVS